MPKKHSLEEFEQNLRLFMSTSGKVCGSYVVTLLHIIFDRYMKMLLEDWTLRPKYIHHRSRINRLYNWEGFYDHLKNKIKTLLQSHDVDLTSHL